MSIVVIPAALAEQLRAAGDGAELRDESGRRIGELRRPELDLSAEEVSARLSPDAKTYTTAEVLDHLRGLK